jgi:hypothetical protein
MVAAKGIWQKGQIVLEGNVDWPEGCEVLVEPLPNRPGKVGIDESEWRDDPASIADWEAWIKTIEPLEFTPEEELFFSRFGQQFRQFNLEAVRRQMEQGPIP